jgi:hypothetical protein
MSYTTTQIKEKFWTYIDEYYTGYWDNSRLTYIFQKALNNIIESKLNFEGSTDKIDDELTPLRREVTGTSLPITLSVIQYKKLGSLLVDYGKGYRTCTPTKSNEIGSVYSKGTVRSPKYKTVNDAGTLKINVEPIGAINYFFTYYKNPLVSDGTDIDFTISSYDVLYPNKLIELIIEEASKIAGQIIREQELQVTSQQNEQLNP